MYVKKFTLIPTFWVLRKFGEEGTRDDPSIGSEVPSLIDAAVRKVDPDASEIPVLLLLILCLNHFVWISVLK